MGEPLGILETMRKKVNEMPKRIEEGKYLDEATITSLSQPYIQVVFFGNPVLASGEPTQYLASRQMITSAEFEGPALHARKGKISFVDPSGIWPSQLAAVSAYQNSVQGKGLPNMKITFGWVGLAKGIDVQSLSGLMLKVSLDISPENGSVTFTVEFIEAAMAWLDTLRFLQLEDMLILDSAEDGKDKKKVSEILNDIVEKSPDISATLTAKGLTISFADTNNDGKIDGTKFKIRFGDSLSAKINEISSQATYTPKGATKDPKINWSYQMISNIDGYAVDESKKMVYKADIKYDWKPSPADETDPNVSAVDTFTANPNIKMREGPTLYWKRGPKQTDPFSKTLIEWSTNLNSKEFLLQATQAELDKVLNNFTETDWQTIHDIVKRSDGNMVKASAAISQEKRSGFFGQKSDKDSPEFNNRQKFVEFFDEKGETKSSPDNMSSAAGQLAAVINMNVFKASAVVIGDPHLGIDMLQGGTVFGSNFSAISDFAKMFERFWLLDNVVHQFSDGKYVTKLELTGLPNDSPPAEAK